MLEVVGGATDISGTTTRVANITFECFSSSTAARGLESKNLELGGLDLSLEVDVTVTAA